MIDYSLILSINYPNKQWTLNGDNYEGLTWLDSSTKPTQAELDALWKTSKVAQAKAEQDVQDAKASALAKLTALGLTQAEVTALLG